ncbi:coiled-coil domain-containing protein [Prosthecobacter dejongeii]|uniref:Chromosome segregation ATPase n=1 Tax=Prosthecobacter dejongeii TaxID=48465 RepID=A0A7W7YNT2_9BACT|nr:hypothetical protein [Prosthecobacter dejongeii]MBB5039593.1 chromosome segregation ATPase [Prosthecobacter dejongeii]
MLDTERDVLISAWMIFTVILASLFEMQTLGALVLVALVSSLFAWWLQERKLRLRQALHAQERMQGQSLLEQVKSSAAEQAASAQLKLEEAKAERVQMEERFASHRDAAQRRETDCLARIGSLETDLATTREIAARLAPTEARVGDLETALRAERGRTAALEQTLSVTTLRAQELTTQLQDIQTRLGSQLEKSKVREAELMQQLANQEQTLAVDQARLGTVDDEISRLKENHAAYQTTAENRITGLQRQLAAAEAKAAMVQKEFMSAVGVLPEPTAAVVGAPNDRRVMELEAKISQTEAEARKKSREDGYRIAELEYRLTEAQEALANPKVHDAASPEIEALKAEVKALTADKEALVHDLETLKMLKAKSVEPVPEVLEQGFLLMDDDAPAQ